MKMSLIKTAICDDIQKELETIRAALDTYAEAHSELYFDIDEYGAAIDVLHAVEKGKVYDIALLDICMPGVLGTDVAEEMLVKSIQIKKVSYTLKKGGTVTLRPKAVLQDKRKKQLSVEHTKEFRYMSSNKKIATVTAGGKVKAKGTGECTIYVFAKNGCRRKIKIEVKK